MAFERRLEVVRDTAMHHESMGEAGKDADESREVISHLGSVTEVEVTILSVCEVVVRQVGPRITRSKEQGKAGKDTVSERGNTKEWSIRSKDYSPGEDDLAVTGINLTVPCPEALPETLREVLGDPTWALVKSHVDARPKVSHERVEQAGRRWLWPRLARAPVIVHDYRDRQRWVGRERFTQRSHLPGKTTRPIVVSLSETRLGRL